MRAAKDSLKLKGDLSKVSPKAIKAMKSIISSGSLDDPGLAELYTQVSTGQKISQTQKARFGVRVLDDYLVRCDTNEKSVANYVAGTSDHLEKEYMTAAEKRKQAEKIEKELEDFEALLKRQQC